MWTSLARGNNCWSLAEWGGGGGGVGVGWVFMACRFRTRSPDPASRWWPLYRHNLAGCVQKTRQEWQEKIIKVW